MRDDNVCGNLIGSTFTGKNLIGSTITGTNLIESRFTGKDLIGCNFTRKNLIVFVHRKELDREYIFLEKDTALKLDFVTTEASFCSQK